MKRMDMVEIIEKFLLKKDPHNLEALWDAIELLQIIEEAGYEYEWEEEYYLEDEEFEEEK